jgi:hypothetical protein
MTAVTERSSGKVADLAADAGLLPAPGVDRNDGSGTAMLEITLILS